MTQNRDSNPVLSVREATAFDHTSPRGNFYRHERGSGTELLIFYFFFSNFFKSQITNFKPFSSFKFFTQYENNTNFKIKIFDGQFLEVVTSIDFMDLRMDIRDKIGKNIQKKREPL